jgi:hypothetical protein
MVGGGAAAMVRDRLIFSIDQLENQPFYQH